MRKIRAPLNNGIEKIKKLGIFSWSIIGFLIIIALFFYLIYLIKVAIIPLILAAAIAYLLSPLVNFLAKKMKKGLAIAIIFIIFTGIVFVIFFFLIPVIIDQSRIFINKFPSYLQNLNVILGDFIEKSTLVKYIEGFTGKNVIAPDTTEIWKYFMGRINFEEINLLQGATIFTKSIFNIVLYLIISPLLGIYILKDIEKIRASFIMALPKRFRFSISSIMDRVNRVAARYIRGQILISIIVGILCTLVLLILKVDFAILLGALAGIFNIIPLLGPIIGAIPAALAALFISPWKALLVILLFVAVQQLDNYIISPNVMKYQVGVHPGIVIISLLISGALFGVWGLLIAVPTVAVLQEILRYYLLEKNKIASW